MMLFSTNMLSAYAFLVYCLLHTILTECQAAASTNTVDDELDGLIETLRTEELVHSGTATITRTKPCVQVSMRNVTVAKAISHLTKKVVPVDQESRFELAYCGADNVSKEPAKCAVDSLCTTVYRWKKARTRSSLFGAYEIYVEDKILLPVSCMCVLGQADEEKGLPTPIIIL